MILFVCVLYDLQEELVHDYNCEIILSICLSQSLRKHLLEELEEAFPDDVEAYRQIRATSAVVSGNTPAFLGSAVPSHVYLHWKFCLTLIFQSTSNSVVIIFYYFSNHMQLHVLVITSLNASFAPFRKLWEQDLYISMFCWNLLLKPILVSRLNLGEVRIYFCVGDAFFVDLHNYGFVLLIFSFQIGLLNERKIILIHSFVFCCFSFLLTHFYAGVKEVGSVPKCSS